MMARRWWVVGWVFLALVGCNGGAIDGVGGGIGDPGGGMGTSPGAPAPGGAGATPGGVKDMALARWKISAGQVPSAEDFVVEGLYSEHDLPLEGPPCEQALCLRTATGIATALDTDRQEVFVQVGLSSNVNPDTFRRKPLDAALVIDRSGSMDGAPIAAVKEAARRLVNKLDENDTLSITAFESESVVLVNQVPVKDRAALVSAINRISASGGTCIECGLNDGYLQLATQREDPSRSRRVFMFTDAMPNVGETDSRGFLPWVREQSQQGRDLSLFGVNSYFGQAFTTALSSVRGSNSFYLSDPERIRSVFDKDFDYLVTPIAYDLKLALTPLEGFRLEAVYGLPGVQPGEMPASLEVSTVFLSRKKGALLARLSSRAGIQPAQRMLSGELSFTPLDREASAPTRLTASYGGGEPLASSASWYSEDSVRKTVALTNFVLGARQASKAWFAGDKPKAREGSARTATLLHEQAEQLDDDGLRAEAKLAAQLAELMAR